MNRYVKIEGYTIWFLLLEAGGNEPDGLSENMQKRIGLSLVSKMHDPRAPLNFEKRLIAHATREIDYEALANKYGTILIQKVGSFMPLGNQKITQEVYAPDFPIEDYAEIVICENDEDPEHYWEEYLKKRFPNKTITVINFFSLRSEAHVEDYFSNAKYITFSTTFTDFGWFKKLTKFATSKHKIIGYCHDESKWEQALAINPNVQIVKSMKYGS